MFIVFVLLVFSLVGIPVRAVEPIPAPVLSVNLNLSKRVNELIIEKQWQEAILLLKNEIKNKSIPQAPLAQSHAAAESLDLYLKLANVFVLSGQREEAVSAVLQLISLYQDVFTAQQRTVIYSRLKSIAEQFLTLETQQIYLGAMTQFKEKNYKGAIQQFKLALERELNNALILFRMGQVFLLSGEVERAEQALRKALSINPYQAETKLWLARALHQKGEIEAAVVLIKQADLELQNSEFSELASIWVTELFISMQTFLNPKKNLVAISPRPKDSYQLPESSGEIVLEKGSFLRLEQEIQRHPESVYAYLTLIKLRYTYGKRDKNNLWQMRRDLQVALSRLPEWKNDRKNWEIFSRVRLKEEIQTLLQKIEMRIQNQNPD